MKYLKILSILLIIAFLFSGCSKDSDKVYVLYEAQHAAGTYILQMDLDDENENPIPPGYYLLKADVGHLSDQTFLTIDSDTWVQDPKENEIQELYPLGGFLRFSISIASADIIKITLQKSSPIGI